MKSIERASAALNRVALVTGGLAALGLMGVAASNVILRMFGKSFPGAYEMVGFLGALVIAMALGHTQRRKDHIMVDILARHFPPWLHRALDALNYLVNLVFFAIVSWQVYLWGMTIRREGEVSETLKIAYYGFVYAVAFGFALLSLAMLADFVAITFGRKKAGQS